MLWIEIAQTVLLVLILLNVIESISPINPAWIREQVSELFRQLNKIDESINRRR